MLVKNNMPVTFKFIDLFNQQNYRQTLLVLILPLAIYWQVWDFAQLWDDNGHLNNFYIKNPNLVNFVRLFSEEFFGMYIPISYLFWGWLSAVAGFFEVSQMMILHLANVVLHTANGVLVLVLLHQFIRNKYAALFGALVFLLHPMQVETVAWMSEFRGVLAAFFTLLAIYFYMRGQTSKQYFTNSQIFAVLFLLLGLLSKPSAAVLPIFIVLINHFHFRFSIKNNLIKSSLFLLITLMFTIITNKIQYYPALEVALWQRPFIWFDSIIIYFFKIIAPFNLSASYSMPTDFFISRWWFYPLALLPLVIGVWGLFVWKIVWQKMRLLTLAVLIFIAGFLPTSGLISFTFQTYSIITDRYLYLAFFGIALVVAAILEQANKRFVWILAAMILTVLTSLSAFRQIPIWQSPATLWSHSRQFEAIPSYATYNDAKVLVYVGRLDEALKSFNLVLSHYPKNRPYQAKHYDLFYNRGVIFFKQKNYQKALSDFTTAIKINPKKLDSQRAKIYSHLQLNQCNAAKKTADTSPIKIPTSLQNHLKKTCLISK